MSSIEGEIGDVRFDAFPDDTSRFVSGTFDDLDDAIDATRELERRGYSRSRISVITAAAESERFVDTHPRYGELEDDAIVVEEVELEKRRRTLEGAGAGGTIGGALGAAGAAIAVAGATLVVRPLGISVAGRFAAALAGAGAGAAAGGLVGALVGSGRSEYRARLFERLVRDGHVTVGVMAETEAERTNVAEVLEAHGGEVMVHDETD